jgi:hypothetical protein
VSIEYTSRTCKTYYLHAGVTKTGKPKYFFSQKQDGAQVDTIPDGFEIYENVEGLVFLRRIPKQIILPEELALVKTALRRHGEDWQYKDEVKKDTITVYECGTDMAGLNEMTMMFSRRPLSDAEKLRSAHYMAVLRFVLADKEARTFVTQRFCFRGSVDDWIHIGGPGPLTDQVGKYVKHLGRESMYELF